MRELIHFAHGNGFPAKSYQEILKPLRLKHQLIHIPMFGHDSRFPVTDNWNFLVDELIAFIELKADQPLIGLGHSLGGALTLMAAEKRPDLFKSLVLLDTPIYRGLKARAIHALKALDLINWVTPARYTQYRRETFSNKEEALSHFKNKKVFAAFSEESLKAYVHSGLYVNDEGNVQLCFRRGVEYAIYRTVPHEVLSNRYFSGPVTLLYGKNSNIIGPIERFNIKRQFKAKLIPMPGSHLFPLECPAQTAKTILELIGH